MPEPQWTFPRRPGQGGGEGGASGAAGTRGGNNHAFGPTRHRVGKGSWFWGSNRSAPPLFPPPASRMPLRLPAGVRTGILVDAAYLCFHLSIFQNETVGCFVPNLLTDFCSPQSWLCRRIRSRDCGYTFRPSAHSGSLRWTLPFGCRVCPTVCPMALAGAPAVPSGCCFLRGPAAGLGAGSG